MGDILTQREKEVLRYIVENFIKLAQPVGSREISKKTDLNLSSATIRNVMSDLEDKDLLNTPHTSSGRVPTDKAYRYYVDLLMSKGNLSDKEKSIFKKQLEEIKNYSIQDDDVYSETSKILGKISHQLAIVTQPFLSAGIFEKLELISVSYNKILVVINLKSGIVRTVILEVDVEIQQIKLENLARYLNEKLHGLTLKQIRDTYSKRISDLNLQELNLIQLFINSIDKIYGEEEKGNKIYISGTGEIITQPEFGDPKKLQNIIEISENKNLVIHIFQNTVKDKDEINISIGSENTEEKLKDYSIICTTYKFGDVKGNIGIIGPKRIDYPKMISLIEYTSRLITEDF
ncbi:MAG: heat-inducible transcription repressor HrcA [Ignavibacteria bacterium]|nr:heat-inducible transcription repressor HrcA [Ignavibacteria bacterium]